MDTPPEKEKAPLTLKKKKPQARPYIDSVQAHKKNAKGPRLYRQCANKNRTTHTKVGVSVRIQINPPACDLKSKAAPAMLPAQLLDPATCIPVNPRKIIILIL